MNHNLPSPNSDLPSDLTPGIPPVVLDRAAVNAQIDRLLAKLDDLRPVIVRAGGLVCCYQAGQLRAQATDANSMITYLNKVFPGAKSRWFLLPSIPQLPINPS